MIKKTNLANPANYTKGRNGSKITYLVMHYTANDGDTDEGNGNYFHNNTPGTSAHYFVDEDSCTLSVNESDTAHHAGDWDMNLHSIGIEMVSRIVNGKYVITPGTVNNAVLLAKEIMAKHNIHISHVIRHYDVTKKLCPRPWVEDESQWIEFKKRLVEVEKEEEIEVEKTYNKIEDLPAWAKPAIQTLVNKGYLSGDTAGNLNLTETAVRIFVVNYRAGLYDK